MLVNRVSTGSIILSYLDYYGIPLHILQTNCAGVDKDYLDKFLKGENRITEPIAVGVCKTIDTLSLEFIYKYDKKYQEGLNSEYKWYIK